MFLKIKMAILYLKNSKSHIQGYSLPYNIIQMNLSKLHSLHSAQKMEIKKNV